MPRVYQAVSVTGILQDPGAGKEVSSWEMATPWTKWLKSLVRSCNLQKLQCEGTLILLLNL